MVYKCDFPKEFKEKAMRDVFVFGHNKKRITERSMDKDVAKLNFAAAIE